MFHNRHIEKVLEKVKNQFPVLLLTGPRQVGKTTLLKRISDKRYKQLTFDDPLIREQAKEDPNLFFINNRPPLLLDEIQYVPTLIT